MPRELKADRILREIKRLNEELKAHQSKCKHKNATFRFGSSTGNYDPSDDSYWKDFKCPTCKKTWTEYQ